MDQLPESIDEWTVAVAHENLTSVSIHDMSLVSASKFGLSEFLPLRVIWRAVESTKFKGGDYELDHWMDDAKKYLKTYPSWSVYQQSFRLNKQPGEGNFYLAKLFQMDAAAVQSKEITNNVVFSPIKTRSMMKAAHDHYATPTKSRNLAGDPASDSSIFQDIPSTRGSRGPEELWKQLYPKAEDEQIVNTALVNFLRAITTPIPSIKSDWTIHRKSFKATFNDAEYEARTDGYLRGKDSSEARVLIEVKAPLRVHKMSEIRMQESAQTVAWLKASPETPRNRPYRRVHVSQDRHEIFLIFAKYGNEYLEYLNGTGNPPSDDPESFLTMHEVGPYNTKDRADMEDLAPIIMALVLRADDDREAEQGKPQGPSQQDKGKSKVKVEVKGKGQGKKLF
ncbi:hypothetical protein BDW59DRAFT_175528 [Aspergillus cavernicola]|uniref:Uncharacterized protein n=1 Tax=Aspergillus cavernicola TaxID=176166 RepID=A0ABR4HP70_9EURO